VGRLARERSFDLGEAKVAEANEHTGSGKHQ
jgi:hypothetical protein